MKNHLSCLLLVFLSWNSTSAQQVRYDNSTELKIPCFSVKDCGECTKTYTCHWCNHDNACHVKGSVHGCSWGANCQAPEPKECAAHTTCSECSLSGHTCHWCAIDNACHAVGSRHGCASGVDCYSNERCRRKEPEKFAQGIITEMPMEYVALVVFLSFVFIVCLSWCFSLWANFVGSIDAGSTSMPPSIIGISLTNVTGPSESNYSAVETEALEEADLEVTDDSNQERQPADEEAANQDQSATNDPAHPLDIAGTNTDYVEMINTSPVTEDENEESAFLLENQMGVEDNPQSPRPIKSMSRACWWMQILSTMLVFLIALLSVYFFPVLPPFSVCNDDVGWAKIVEHIIALRIDASFELLISLSNPNRIAVALDAGSGTFQFDGRPLGTFVIPSFTVENMAISDLMILAKASPDRQQAYKIVQAYMNGSLILDADFDATIRIPALFNHTRNVTVKRFPVDVTAAQDRTLCRCPTWNDNKNSSSHFLLDSITNFQSFPELN